MHTPVSYAKLSLEQDPRMAPRRTETGDGRHAENKRQPAELAGRRAEAGAARSVGEWTGLQRHTAPVRAGTDGPGLGDGGGGDEWVGGWVMCAEGCYQP